MKYHEAVKQTEIGMIPKEWEVVKLGDPRITEASYYGITAKACSHQTGLKMLRTTDIKDSVFNYKNLPHCEITDSRNKIDQYKLFEGDIIVARAGTVGVSILVERDYDDTIFGSYLIKVRLKRKKIYPRFVYYFFQSNLYWNHMQKAQGSTLKNINLPLLKSLDISLPSLPEQKKIAEILSAVDQAIEKVDEATAKTERLKKGLMQELLTKGIGHKEFIDTEIGKMPKEWEVVRLKEIADINKESRDPNREFPEKEFLYIDIDSIENETGVIRSAKRIIGKEAPSRARRLIRYGDVIMSTVRPYLKAFAIISREYDAQICSTGFAVLSCTERILASYLLYILFSNSVMGQCNRMMVGAQYPALNNSQVEKIEIPLAPLPEQKKIAEILSTADKRLQLLREKKEKLKRVKRGLMNDLLTGKRRVKTLSTGGIKV